MRPTEVFTRVALWSAVHSCGGRVEVAELPGDAPGPSRSVADQTPPASDPSHAVTPGLDSAAVEPAYSTYCPGPFESCEVWPGNCPSLDTDVSVTAARLSTMLKPTGLFLHLRAYEAYFGYNKNGAYLGYLPVAQFESAIMPACGDQAMKEILEATQLPSTKAKIAQYNVREVHLDLIGYSISKATVRPADTPVALYRSSTGTLTFLAIIDENGACLVPSAAQIDASDT